MMSFAIAALGKAFPFLFAAAGNCTLPSHSFFFIPTWWEYLPTNYNEIGVCEPTFHFPADTWAIGLAILDMLLRIGGFLAVISIIIAGVQYITSTGNSDKATAARKRITNSLIGLAIVLFATAIVSFIGNSIGG